MIDHTGIVVSDLGRARHFYDAIAKPLGLSTADNGKDAFLLGHSAERPIPFHAAGIAAGGRDNGPPGPRRGDGYYGAGVTPSG